MEKEVSFKKFIKEEYSELSNPKNIHFPVDNIIVGLLTNMLRKNIGYSREGFIEKNKYFFKVVLDTTGFEEELILEAIDALSLNAQKFYKDGILFSSQIQNIEYNHEDKLVSFNLEKDKLIFHRDSILKSK